jgi:guanyl-specific ribonuclease Sa
MNKLSIVLSIACTCLVAKISHAQWSQGTNILTTNNSVGIGVPAPVYPLCVNGNIYTNGSLMVDGGDVYISRQIPGGWGYVVRPNVPNQKNLQFAVSGGGPLDLIALNSGTTFTTGKLDVYLGGAAPATAPNYVVENVTIINFNSIV